MTTIKSREAQNRFGLLLDTVQSETVTITKRDRPVAVVVSPSRYAELEAMEDAFWSGRAKFAADKGYAGVEDTAKLIQEILSGDA
jgi:prevent-host-death family protein